MEYQPKPSTFNGVTFRSRLEARWARFLQLALVEWEYEPQVFRFDDVSYLPDFRLPRLKAWLEVKPPWPKPVERRKASLLACRTGQVVYVLFGPSGFGTSGMSAVMRDVWDIGYRWTRCPVSYDVAPALHGFRRAVALRVRPSGS